MNSFNHSFEGYTSEKSHCNVRILDEGKKIVVIFSQGGSHTNTSITNQIENLIEDIKEYLQLNNLSGMQKIIKYVKGASLTCHIDKLIEILRKKIK